MAWISLLRDCAKRKDLIKGSRIHAEIAKSGLLHDMNICLGNSLVNMYAKCGAFVKAHAVFDELPVQDVVSWNILIGEYAKYGHGKEALICYEEMRLNGICPTAVTFVFILKACGIIRETCKGQEIHYEVVRLGLLKKNCIVGNALVGMYAKCGELAKARDVFNKLPFQTVISWTVLIAGYIEHGHDEDALECFKQIELRGLSPDALTFVCGLKACGNVGDASKGQELHAAITRARLLERNNIVGNALIDMYATCGMIRNAKEVFDDLFDPDLFSWTSLISGYAQYGHESEAVKCFERLQLEGLFTNVVTIVCTLKACGNTGVVFKGKQIHTKMVSEDLLEEENVVNALVNMYVKCGAFLDAQSLFGELSEQDVISWNTLIAGYAHLGEEEKAFNSFDKMMAERKNPNVVTFSIVLNLCNHGGLLEKCLIYLEMMNKNYNIIPTLEHHTCIVDSFGRAGDLYKAVEVIDNIPFLTDPQIWVTLLGVCQKWGDVELGEFAFQHAISLDDKDAATYVCMSNIYRATGRHEDAKRIETKMNQVEVI